MIPRAGASEIAKRELEDLSEDGPIESEESPYFEYEWFGETHSYTAAGYWGRIIFVIILAIPVAVIFAAKGETCGAALFLVIIAGGIGISLLALASYRNRI